MIKSFRPSEVNFNFLKEFLCDIKHDFMRFVNGLLFSIKLVKGSNFTSIVLVMKKDSPWWAACTKY